MRVESFKDKKFHDSTKYKDVRVRVNREIADFVDGYYNFNQFNSYQEYLSVLLERTLEKLLAELKVKLETNKNVTLT